LDPYEEYGQDKGLGSLALVLLALSCLWLSAGLNKSYVRLSIRRVSFLAHSPATSYRP